MEESDFDGVSPPVRPGDVYRWILQLPYTLRDVSAGEAVGLFSAVMAARKALGVAEDAVLLMARENGATIEMLAEQIGKGYVRSAASRLEVRNRRYPLGSADVLAKVERELQRLSRPPEPR